jgi:hypothetical protein
MCAGLFRLPKYLSITKRVDANILVVEGWLSDDVLEQVRAEIKNHKYDLILTAGESLPEDFELLQNGTLIFNNLQPVNRPLNDTLIVNAYGMYAGKSNAHFIVNVNNIIIGEAYVTENLAPYKFNLPKEIIKIEKVKISFDNDYFTSPRNDRNLFIRSILIGNQETYAVNDSNLYVTDYSSTPAFTTTANRAAYDLKQLGISGIKIISVPFKESNKIRTLTGAINLERWISNSNINVRGINLFSEGVHARKSWLVYRYALRDKYPVGVISGCGNFSVHNRSSLRNNSLRMVHESIEIIYFQIHLLFLHNPI